MLNSCRNLEEDYDKLRLPVFLFFCFLFLFVVKEKFAQTLESFKIL